MKTLVLSVSMLLAGAVAHAQTQQPATPAKTKAVIESLTEAAAKAKAAADSGSAKKAAAGESGIFDNTPQLPKPVPVQTLPKKAKSLEKTAADDGIVFPEDPPKKDEGGQDPETPADQVAKMIAEALKKKEVTDQIDRIREDQMSKVLNKKVMIGVGVAGAGAITAGIGLITGVAAVTGVGLAIIGGVLLLGALFGLFGGGKKKE